MDIVAYIEGSAETDSAVGHLLDRSIGNLDDRSTSGYSCWLDCQPEV